MNETPEPSIVGILPSFPWSTEKAVSNEVTIEGINQVIGMYSALIARHRQQDAAPDVVDELRVERQKWATRRRTLSPVDAQEVRRVQRECAAVIADLRSRL